ncbi:cobalt ECF transporter T component CbiQ [Thermoleptolyngbya sichuanensis A183]|uniref:Cobalt ECF transporter T component CbiQ n=1 Tax=Thermoleptolyngbya sichuanensis A183 TaxID=2737172 RepID=A0A6M8BA21_9CYAN|nr:MULTISPECIES: cobalt ECF transporter T component CbiQ [Thermoleptolyngbya]QKD83348.1 cobalt ECF transporter T component CbiQ [Thermoleptolyngbya sichuanensis A183]
MRLVMDEFAHLDSPIHRWEPRCKLLGLVTLMFAFAFVERGWLVPVVLAIALSLYGLSRLPLSFLRSRLRYPGYFLLGVVALLPFCSGQTVLWQLGPVVLRQEGLSAMLLIAGRFLAIVTTGFILLGTTPFLTLVAALRSLGLPPVLADMTLLTYRYLFDLAETLATMKLAMRLRGFGQVPSGDRHRGFSIPFLPRRTDLGNLSALAGTLLIRSYEQSERVYKAMRLRGYGYTPRSGAAPVAQPKTPFSTLDLASMMGLAGAVALAIALLGLGFVPVSFGVPQLTHLLSFR